MKRRELNSKFRDFARSLSSTPAERDLVSRVYGAVSDALGAEKCTQIGSYPRYTAITPIHDLDIIVCLGRWDENIFGDSDLIMKRVMLELEERFRNPTSYHYRMAIQSHSITIKFLNDGNEERFAVDIVPAYSNGKNNYGDSMYMVPQVLGQRRGLRHIDWNLADESNWIRSDPRGYIKLATEVGENSDFRKAVKLVKFWKKSVCSLDEALKLKSFHLEQVVLQQFLENPEQDVFGALFNFFYDLRETVLTPNQVRDRAQPEKFIDDYIANLSEQQKEVIFSMRDAVLIELEGVRGDVDIEHLLTARRADKDKADDFLFEKKIPMFYDDAVHSVEIICEVAELGNRAMRRACKKEKVALKRELTFRNKNEGYSGDYWWKVKNSRELPMEQRRGELTLGRTLHDPEHTEYFGHHYVECYRVVKGECIDVDRFDVIVAKDGGLSFE